MPPLNRFKKLDVRPLLEKGHEPYLEIRKAVDALQPGQGLVVTAPFLPAPLIEKLRSEGFSSKVERGATASWVAYFWREEHAPAA